MTGSCTNDWPYFVVMFSLLFLIIFNPFLVFTVVVHRECVLLKGVASSVGSRFGLSSERRSVWHAYYSISRMAFEKQQREITLSEV